MAQMFSNCLSVTSKLRFDSMRVLQECGVSLLCSELKENLQSLLGAFLHEVKVSGERENNSYIAMPSLQIYTN